jgi:hypothetical protein
MSIPKTHNSTERPQIGTETTEKEKSPKTRVPKSARPKPAMKPKAKSEGAEEWSTTNRNSASSSTRTQTSASSTRHSEQANSASSSSSSSQPSQLTGSNANLVSRSGQHEAPKVTNTQSIKINFDCSPILDMAHKTKLQLGLLILQKQVNDEVEKLSTSTTDNRSADQKMISVFAAKAREYLSAMDKLMARDHSPLNYLSLISISATADDDNLKEIFEVALGYQAKGIDVPSMIFNEAIEKGNVELITRLRRLFPAINLASGLQEALSSRRLLAYNESQVAVIKMMVADGGKPKDDRQRSLLESFACRTGDVEFMRLLLDKDISSPDINFGSWALGTAPLLHQAARYGHLPLVKFMIERGYDVNQTHDIDRTVLLDACSRKGNLAVVKYLVEECPNLKPVNKRAYLTKAYEGMTSPSDYDIRRYLENTIRSLPN